MSNTFLIADTHFGHKNILSFLREDNTPLRPGFTDIREHDETLVNNWNSVVKPNDKVYHLGDCGFKNFTYMKHVFDQLNGTKVLIKGNHDNFKLSQYAQLFKDIRGIHSLDKILLSHIPIHPNSLSRWKGNAHGHLHNKHVENSHYLNLCVENWNYTPVPFETIRSYFNNIIKEKADEIIQRTS
jgi:calcineurin-like phosphoesterase family protein